VPAKLAGQRPLLERAASGDREAFARLYDAQVDGVYRYLLAWSGDPAQAAALTAEVFAGAFGWLAVTHAAEGEVAAWLTAMARDAVARRRGPGGTPAGADPVAAVARLSDPRREVVVLRLLCGHSLDHTAHLSGFTRRAVQELQLSACRAIWELTAGATAPPPQEPTAEEFERHLAQGDLDQPGHAILAGPLAVARSLRQAAHRHVAGPDPALVERLRHALLTGEPAGDLGPRLTLGPRSRGPRIGRVAQRRRGGQPRDPADHGHPAEHHQLDRGRPGARALGAADLGGDHPAEHPPADHRSPGHGRAPADDHHPGDDHDRPDDHRGDDHHGAGADLTGQLRPKTWWRVATAVSGLSENTPSTPRRKNSRSSAGRSPAARMNSGLAGLPWRKSSGRKLFSRRNVHGWTTRPARWTSRTRLVGSSRFPAASRGTIRLLLGPSPSA
jgi:DNA-directed RNA polymerase specialized sigma24 family protein